MPNRFSLVASVGFAALLVLAQTGSALAIATAPNLGTAQSFAVLGASTVTNTGNSIIRGDLGLSPGTAVTGFPPGIVVPPGTAHVTDAVALGAQNDATTAYNNLAGQACDFGPFGPTDLAGQNLAPGVYCFSSSVQNSGVLTLNGLPTDVWIFRIGSTLTAGPSSSVVGTGSKCNIFWQVGSSATLDTTTTFEGTIIALQSISMNNGVTLNGRALARNAAVTLINDTIDASGCAGVPSPGGVGLFKDFSPSPIVASGVSTLTITFTNTNSTAATLTAPFTDNFPAGVVIAGTPNVATTCGGAGVPTAVPGGSSVSLPTGDTIPGGSVAVPGFCTLTVNVTASIAGSYLNTVPVGALQTSGGNNTVSSAATLSVTSATGGVGLSKDFSPSAILAGGVSTLTVTFTNTNSAAATLTAPFTDNFPGNLVIASTPNVATTCGGAGVPTAVPGGSSVSLPTGDTIPGGSIAIPGFCTLTVNVTASIAGSYLNTVPIGALQTSGGNNTVSPTVILSVTTATAHVPTLSQWGMMALMLLLVLGGVTAMRRRNT